MSNIVYEAAVYSRTVKYTNFKGETNETKLYFALDPLQLLAVFATFEPKKKTRSGNPATRNQEPELTGEQQLKFIRDLACKAAGFPSEDGESFEPFENFTDSIAGKAFLTKLTSSDADRKEFAEKVILAPFEAFVGYASADPDNSPKEIQQFQTMLEQMRNLFAVAEQRGDETLEDRKARLAAELASLDGPAEGTQHPNL